MEFESMSLETYCNKTSLSKEQILTDQHLFFRFTCFHMNNFMRYVKLPIINLGSTFEAVFIEFRVLVHIEFLIRNAIHKLGSAWSFTIICGKLNFNFIKDVVKKINRNVKIIKLDYDNITVTEYNKLLVTEEFWNNIHGEKTLIYQEDSMIFHKNIGPFLQYDYIGAPFPKYSNDTPNGVGNGGLSLRSKSKMIQIIKTISPLDTKYNDSTLNYMNQNQLTFPPEDVYFSKNMQNRKLGLVANKIESSLFSSEHYFEKKSFGGHKFWMNCKKWVFFLINIVFNFKYYTPKSNLNAYLKINDLDNSLNLTAIKSNAFDVDLHFFRKVQRKYLKYKNVLPDYLMFYFKNHGLEGLIYHPKQITNIYQEDIGFYTFNDDIFVYFRKIVYPVRYFTKKFIYSLSHTEMCDVLIKTEFMNLIDSNGILLLVFIGCPIVGEDLIQRIVNYKLIEPEFNVAFCFNSKEVFNNPKIKNMIQTNFYHYAIFLSKNLGTDITSTLLMYNEIRKSYTPHHIIKLHTKTIKIAYIKLTTFLLDKPIKQIIELKSENSNCVGEPTFYVTLQDDVYNNKLKYIYRKNINALKQFIGGTIFYCDLNTMDMVLNFVKKNNFRAYYLNNMYDNNSINNTCSPIHFLERLFGVIKE